MKKIYCALFLFLTACQHSDKVDFLNDSRESRVVKSETVLAVAKNFDAFISVASDENPQKNARAGSNRKSVKKITPFNDDFGITLYYVITYNEGGFIIISAEKKTMPILAFSETENFPVDQKLPAGIRDMMDYYKDGISKIRLSTSKTDPVIVKEWERFENSSAINEFVKTRQKLSSARVLSEPENPECQESQIYTNPLITTAWGQSCGFNAQMPTSADKPSLSACSLIQSCDHAYTGCDATAMAQVMNFHHFPNSFTWSAMGIYETETQRLMRSAADRLNAQYSCTATAANPNDIPAVFRSYGYNNGVYHKNFNTTDVMNEIILYGRPIILSGWNSAGGNGHTWVADAVYQNYNCVNGWSVPMFHMNWGWYGAHNGFYGSLTPNGYNFNYNVKMEANIHP